MKFSWNEKRFTEIEEDWTLSKVKRITIYTFLYQKELQKIAVYTFQGKTNYTKLQIKLSKVKNNYKK